MIVTCVCGDKKFEVDATLIPEEGRLVQCGFCDRKWHLKKEYLDENILQKNEKSKVDNLLEDNNLDKVESQNDKSLNEIAISDSDRIDNPYLNEKSDIKKTVSTFKILNYLLVVIISFIALVILLDTFKGPLSGFLPGLENVLQNLNETLKDIFLFFKDLMI